MQARYLLTLLAAGTLGESAVGQAPPPYTSSDYGGDPTALVNSWYRRYLGRDADPGSAAWVQQLQTGSAPDAVLASILGSDEYYRRSGGTPQAFVQRLFQDLQGRQPSPRELDYWVRRAYTADRGTVAYELVSRNPGSWQAAPEEVDEGDYRPPRYRYRHYREGDRHYRDRDRDRR